MMYRAHYVKTELIRMVDDIIKLITLDTYVRNVTIKNKFISNHKNKNVKWHANFFKSWRKKLHMIEMMMIS